MGVAAVGLLAVVTACSTAGSATNGGSGTKSATASGCKPVPGGRLVVLADDKKLEAANNIVPALNAKAASPTVLAALDKASAALTTQRLIGLNKATDVQGKSPKEAAEGFESSTKFTDGIKAGKAGSVVIGASNFSESQSLAFIYQIALNAAGYDARVQPVGNREAYEPALKSGDVDLVPEYLGTLTEFLNQKVNGADAKPLATGDIDKTFTALKGLGAKRGLEFGQPAKATAQNAFAVTKALADKYHVATLSDFAAKCSGQDTVLAGPPECQKYRFCQPGLEDTYGLVGIKFTSLDAGGPGTKTALTQGNATIGLVFTSDAVFAD